MVQVNNKLLKTILKVIEAGYGNEKAILSMTVEDMLALPNVSVAEISIINDLQKAVKANKVISFLGGQDGNEDKIRD